MNFADRDMIFTDYLFVMSDDTAQNDNGRFKNLPNYNREFLEEEGSDWGFKYALKFVSKRASFPPLGLLTSIK